MAGIGKILGTSTLMLGFAMLGLAADPQDPKKKGDSQGIPPILAELMKGSADDFIKRFDKNQKGYIKKEDFPPRLAEMFKRADNNNDGKLDKKEVEDLLLALRKQYGVQPSGAVSKDEVEKVVNQILERMDSNKDGKISRDEARGLIAMNFDELDLNKDGFLDRAELRKEAERRLADRARQNNPPRPNPQNRPPAVVVNEPDFDALDLNADGRLTREELKNTPYASKFDEIDTNKDGKIDRKEFAAYFRKEAEKKAQAEKQKEEEKKKEPEKK
ncbi:MAG TPA: EF-hand domain-containing protein [Gemmataceae bacterium]|nr:EF-hand domain-containing protein [Gemmataceae bacterium]